MSPKILTVVRIPEFSDIRPWLLELADRKVVSLAGSAYRRDEERDDSSVGQIRYKHRMVGGKWSGIYDFFRENADLIDEFEYFWFPDDDIETTADVAARFLDTAVQEKFALSQPALTADSYYAHHITLANPEFLFRRTNFVELMLPLMSASFLRKALPLFRNRHAALGIDLFWHQLTADPSNDVAIVDDAPMGHYRPRQVHLKSNMNSMQVDILSERAITLDEFSVRRPGAVVLSAKRKSNQQTMERGLLLCVRYFYGIWLIRKYVIRPKWSWWPTMKLLTAQLCTQAERPCFDRSAYQKIASKRL